MRTKGINVESAHGVVEPRVPGWEAEVAEVAWDEQLDSKHQGDQAIPVG